MIITLLTLINLASAQVYDLPQYATKKLGKPPMATTGPVRPKPTIKIAIIDTGYDFKQASAPLKLCKTGHFDYAKNTATVGAVAQHGSMVASIIAADLLDVDYCAIVFQVVSEDDISTETLADAFQRAQAQGVVAINLSIQGYKPSFIERTGLAKILAKGVKVFVAAGNDNLDMDNACNSYPGCYHLKGLYMVGALTNDYQQKAPYSNYGSHIDLWYPGDYITMLSYARGTSFAAPRALADYVFDLAQRK